MIAMCLFSLIVVVLFLATNSYATDYDAIVDRASDAADMVPAETRDYLLGEVPLASVVLSRALRLPNMSTGTERMPVLNGLPVAYFRNEAPGATSFAKTTQATWSHKDIVAGEVVVILPIPKTLVADAKYPLWDQIRPQLVEACGAVIDAAILHGTGKPTAWPAGLISTAITNGLYVEYGTGLNLYHDLFDEGGVNAKLEALGLAPTGYIALNTMKSKFRGVVDLVGRPIFLTTPGEKISYTLDGEPIDFVRNGSMDASVALLAAVDWTKVVFSIRQDITFEVNTSGVITDPATGLVIQNFMQQGVVGLIVTMRLGWETGRVLNRMNFGDATAYPAAVLTPAGAGSGSGS